MNAAIFHPCTNIQSYKYVGQCKTSKPDHVIAFPVKFARKKWAYQASTAQDIEFLHTDWQNGFSSARRLL